MIIFVFSDGRMLEMLVGSRKPLLWNVKWLFLFLILLWLCLAAIRHRSLTSSCYFSASTWLFFCSLNFHVTNVRQVQRRQRGEEERAIFPPNSDRLESLTTLLTLKSHDWNTEYECLHSLSTATSNPDGWRFELPILLFFLPLRRYHEWDRGFRCSSLHNVNRQLGIYWILPPS